LARRSGVVSIVVVNHNYERFLPDAIDSALGQTHDHVEVIVVDDGSSDDSRSVIERYEDRVVAVLKDNGGQASAFNAGFARTSGGAVVFLDADDALDERTAARVADAWRTRPALAKVHYRLGVVDAEGRPTGALTPPAALALPSGDLRDLLRRHPDDVPYPPASGNAFAAWALERVLPMPEDEYRVLADVYLLNLVPLLGPVEALDGVGGRYRVHDANARYASTLRLDRVRSTVRVTHTTHGHMKALADSLGLEGFPTPEDDDRSLVFLSHRLVSRKLEPRLHPLRADTPGRLALRGAAAALRRRDVTLGFRLLHVAWFVAMAAAPRRRAGAWLAEQLLYPARRGRLSALIDRLRRSS
jgi:CTP:molybdopterin cytidylyltransferase MocA